MRTCRPAPGDVRRLDVPIIAADVVERQVKRADNLLVNLRAAPTVNEERLRVTREGLPSRRVV